MGNNMSILTMMIWNASLLVYNKKRCAGLTPWFEDEYYFDFNFFLYF